MLKSLRLFIFTVFLIPITCSMLSSCASNEEFDARMDRRNDAYMGYDHRRSSRLDARQERTDAWFDRAMH